MQLGDEKLDVRIGGIYALERVARDSARDHPTVMEVLTAFIREHSRDPRPEPDATLRRADLTDADLTDADLTDAWWPEDAPVPPRWERDPGSGCLEAASTDSGPGEAD